MRSEKISWRTHPPMAYVCSIIVLTMCCSVGIYSQNIFGRISGTVTDPAGAVVPQTTITITNQATNVARTATTDSNGFYVEDDLPSGVYTVTAGQSGFKTVTMETCSR